MPTRSRALAKEARPRKGPESHEPVRDSSFVLAIWKQGARERYLCARKIQINIQCCSKYRPDVRYLKPKYLNYTNLNRSLMLDFDVKLDLAEQDRRLSKLFYTDGANFDSPERQNEPYCLPDTRVDTFFFFFKSCLTSIYNLSVMTDPPKITFPILAPAIRSIQYSFYLWPLTLYSSFSALSRRSRFISSSFGL